MPVGARFSLALIVAATSTATSALATPQNWHAPGWSHRAVVKVTGGAGGGVDVAAVRIIHAGVARTDGADYRIFDESRNAVPYEITFHAPGRETLISFRSPRPAGVFFVYFGKADAAADPMRAVVDPRPGAGPPDPGPSAGGWIPRAGLVLTTMRRPRDADNPKTVNELATLMEKSARPDGAGYRSNIRDGYNPFGDSDYFISVYRGWIRLPKTGTYGFCTASNEASFSFLDGATLVHWPGRHTEQRGKYGEKSAQHDLAAGLHYVEYYHEEVLLYQVAFLGYRPPGAGRVDGIPDSLFPQPHSAAVTRYERGGGTRTVMPRAQLTDSVWPNERPAGQYARYSLIADSGTDPIDFNGWAFHWDSGDGLSAGGNKVDHVYLAVGDYDVRLTVTAPDGHKVERRWPLTVFPIEHLEGGFKAGNYADYVPIVSAYDHSKLSTPVLAELAHFFNEPGKKGPATDTATALLARSDASDANRMDALLILAGDAGTQESAWRDSASPDATERLRSALDLAADPVNKMLVLARLIRCSGLARADVDAADELYAQSEALVKEHGLRGYLKRAFRHAVIAVGDAHLAAGDPDGAHKHYHAAEALAEPVIPQVVRASRIGAYPERLGQLIDAGKHAEAEAVLQEWYDQFPSDLPRGELLFWMAKLEDVPSNPQRAIRPLNLAVELGRGAPFEAEARWLLAESHRKTGDTEARRMALEGLVQSGLAGPWREKAIAALKELSAQAGDKQ